ncbi:hypothetical protein HDU93_001673 [Gonapodya sp. JEL0774]|nr:hypothetical protein HDU93_001673 [Gonapodya sp. JEL0774]
MSSSVPESLHQEHGVEKIFHLQPGPISHESRSVLYLCRPKLSFARQIADHVKASRTASSSDPSLKAIDFSVFFVPRKTLVCEKLFEEEGVLADLTIGEYHLDLVPLEDDFLSLEVEGSFRELYLEGDTTCVYYLAKAIMKLQTLYGVAPRIVGKGTYARVLADLLVNLRRELLANTANLTHSPSSSVFPSISSIDSIIVLDRSVDLVTPLCMQLTYEGLIDEVFGIRSSFIEVDASVLSQPANSSAPPSGPPRRRKVPLSSSDPLHARLRDLNFAVVGGVLNEVARKVQTEYEERHAAKTVGEIRSFVGRLGGLREEHQSVALHTHLAELITTHTLTPEFNSTLEAQQNFVSGIASPQHVDLIEDMIGKQEPVEDVIRLLCLYNMAVGGVKGKGYDGWRREVVQTYGYHHLLTFHHLSTAGLLPKPDAPTTSGFPRILAGSSATAASSSTTGSIAGLRKQLRLIVDDVDDQNPADMSYVFSGYAPGSVRVLQMAVTGGVGGSPASSGLSVSAGGTVGGTSSGQGKGKDGVQTVSIPLPPRPVGWSGVDELMKKVPGGPHFEELQSGARTASPSAATSESESGPGGTQGQGDVGVGSAGKAKGKGKTTLVVFLGGCTYAEVAAVRFLGQMEEVQRDFVVLTTGIVNARTLLESVMQKKPGA